MADGHGTAVFNGVPREALAVELARFERRHYDPGATLITAGDPEPTELYVVQAGVADVFVADRHGREHLVGRVGPGAALGEMALFTGQQAGASVRAASELTVLVLHAADLHRLGAAFPVIYRNLGVMLAERLALSNRRVANAGAGRVTLLVDQGAPPVLGYALSCSLAWHVRRPVLLLLLAEEPPAVLVRLAQPADATALLHGGWSHTRPEGSTSHAALAVAAPRGPFAPEALSTTLQELCELYDHVLVHWMRPAAEPFPGPLAGERAVRLLGAGALAATPTASQLPSDGRPGQTLCAWEPGAGRPRPGPDGVLRIPALSPADEAALRTGVLPPASAAGRALGWLARDLAGLKVGLALGAGAVKGYAHLGVLRVLERYGVPIDYVAGTSIGAAVAALFAAGFSSDEAAARMDDVGGQAFRPTLSTTGLLSSNGLRAGLQRAAGNARIEELRLPLAIVAADILQRREVVFRRGLVWPAVLASMSIPGIYPPLRLRGMTLVDGGVLNPVPATVVAEMGADVVIGVKLATRPAPLRGDASVAAGFGASPSVLQAILRTIELMQSTIGAETAATATLLIEPAFAVDEGWGLRNFKLGRRLIPAGEAAAEAAMPRIALALPWLQQA